MDKIETLIKTYLGGARGRSPGRRTDASYPEPTDVYRYLNDEMDGSELERMLDFLKGNEEGQALILRAREVMRGENAADAVPAPLIKKAASLMGAAASCPHCGKLITSFRRPLSSQRRSNLLWFSLSAFLFALSFLFHRYFMQFLAAAVLAGMKAILDMRGTRTQIMIYKALSDDGSERGHLHHHSSRL